WSPISSGRPLGPLPFLRSRREATSICSRRYRSRVGRTTSARMATTGRATTRRPSEPHGADAPARAPNNDTTERCVLTACLRAEHRPWAAVQREQKRMAAKARGCRDYETEQGADRIAGCEVVYANA